mmetsp:Transcript_4022/g.4524  ORF Transcript_4022/g.4524 Transcript_4022/m.4524 type:complete len:122 (+) Transcript_4022:87-452(+)
MCVLTTQGDNECYTTYIVQVESNTPDSYHMVQTRYRHFRKIYDWILQHSLIDAVTQPQKPPKKTFYGSSSVAPANVSKRREWLEKTLRSVQREQPLLLDPLLDQIGIISRAEHHRSRKRTI